MDRLFSQIPLALSSIIGLIAFLFLYKAFIAPQILKWQNKGQSNKLLLKELLEGFGLEVPSELNETDVSTVKSIKGP